jgi:bifunctional DNA-binding transcriptional regulator/antitoxin component of YhaV-PrlF toxin-antitoxin module
MPTVKVQERKVTAKGKDYNQYWIGLPKSIAEAVQIKKGSELEVFVERGDLVLRLI